MPKYDKLTLSQQAQELGFNRDTFEKVCRLSSVLSFIQTDPILGECLALKGGTAINLMIFNLPRLSVDIDLDYAKNNAKDEMLEERLNITNIIKRYMAAEGYEFSEKSKKYHSLDSFIFTYINAAGVRDNIKIEMNYSLRCHIFPLERRRIKTLGYLSAADVLSIEPIEIFASKIVALLSRTAARDLYDINKMLEFDLFGVTQEDILRKCVVFYCAICFENVPDFFDFDRLRSLTKYKIKTDLLPVIRKTEKFDLASAQERIMTFLTKLLILNEAELLFLNEFRNKKYRPALLFDGDILKRIENHPMALWKCQKK
jgi:predicted nucleotidyltransferase component of viral defense system